MTSARRATPRASAAVPRRRKKQAMAATALAPAVVSGTEAARLAPWWPFAQAMSETDLRANVVRYAKMQGWLVYYIWDSRVWKTEKDPVTGEEQRVGFAAIAKDADKGYPDLTLARSGEVLFRELKRQREYPTSEQRAWLAALGILGGVWRPSDWYDGTIERVLGRGAG